MNIGNAIEVLSSIFSSGGSLLHRQIIITGTSGSLTIPVTPAKYTVGDGAKNKVVDIEQVGEALIFGMPKARTLSFSGFFPSTTHDYPFVVGDSKTPSDIIDTIKKWMTDRTPVRVLITDSPVNLMMGIMDFSYWEQDGSRDIYYSISFTEYKQLNVPAANNMSSTDDTTGLQVRPVDLDAQIAKEQASISSGTSLSTKVSDVMDVAKKTYGDYTHWRNVVKSNNLSSLIINNSAQISKWVIKK